MLSTLLGSMSSARFDDWAAPSVPSVVPLVTSSELLMGMPSTINSGWLLPCSEVMPRMLMLVDEPGRPLELVMLTPDTLPCSAFSTFGSDFWAMSSPLICCWVVFTDRTSFSMPSAVTTTSLSCLLSLARAILNTEPVPMAASAVAKPTELNTRVPPLAGTLSVNEPSLPVELPTEVPFSSTVTPGRPSAVCLSVTRPVTLRSWAEAYCSILSKSSRPNSKCFFIMLMCVKPSRQQSTGN